jgi:inorganic pyrophosphatase
MSLHNVTPGANAPNEFNVIIEIPMNADPIKYEVDHDTGALFVDRFMSTAMHYPCNYGYIPNTLADDGDPVDVLVITPVPLIPGVVVTCRPLGMLKMDDEAGGDNKLLAVPIDKILSIYSGWKKPEDLNPLRLKTIQHFFEHYKDLEVGKWVKVLGWEGVDSALQFDQTPLNGLRSRNSSTYWPMPAPSAARKSATAAANRWSRSQCADAVATGSRPRAILCSPCAPPSKRCRPFAMHQASGW